MPGDMDVNSRLDRFEDTLKRLESLYLAQESVIGKISKDVGQEIGLISKQGLELETMKGVMTNQQRALDELRNPSIITKPPPKDIEGRKSGGEDAALPSGADEIFQRLNFELQVKLRRHEEQMQLLEEKNEKYMVTVNELQSNVRQNSTLLKSIETNTDYHGSLTKLLDAKALDAESGLEGVRSFVNNLRSVVDAHETQIHRLGSICDEIGNEHETSEGFVSKIMEDIRTIKHDMAELRMTINRTNEQQSQSEQALQRQIDGLKSGQESTQAAFHQVRVEVGQTMAQFRLAIRDCENRLKEHAEIMRGQSADIHEIRKDILPIADLTAKMKQVQDDVHWLKGEAETLTGNVKSLGSKTAHHDVALGELRSNVGDQGTSLEKLRITTDVIQTSVDEIESGSKTLMTMEEITKFASEAKTEIAKLRQFETGYNETLDMLKQACRTNELGMQTMASNIKSLESNTNRVNRMLKNDIDDVRQQQGQVEMLASQLDAASHTISDKLEKVQKDSRATANRVEAINSKASEAAKKVDDVVIKTSTQEHVVKELSQTAEVHSQKLLETKYKVREASEFLSKEAEEKLLDLGRTTDINEKMSTLGWIARYVEWVPQEKIWQAIDGFVDWCNLNQNILRKCDFVQEEVVKSVLRLLQNSGVRQLPILIGILDCLMRLERNVEVVAVHGGCAILVRLLESQDEYVLVSACKALRSTTKNNTCIHQIHDANGIRNLLDLLSHNVERVAEWSAATLRSCTRLDQTITQLLETPGAFHKLLQVLSLPNEVVHDNITATLRNCVRDDRVIPVVQMSGGLPILCNILDNAMSTEIEKSVHSCLKVCASNLKAQVELSELGVLERLGLKYPLIRG